MNVSTCRFNKLVLLHSFYYTRFSILDRMFADRPSLHKQPTLPFVVASLLRHTGLKRLTELNPSLPPYFTNRTTVQKKLGPTFTQRDTRPLPPNPTRRMFSANRKSSSFNLTHPTTSHHIITLGTMTFVRASRRAVDPPTNPTAFNSTRLDLI